MTTKSSYVHFVDFFATSPRLATAARNAAKQNKALARSSAVHELGHAIKISKDVTQLHSVMLSHADDDHLLLGDPRMQHVVAKAFHLLFTEPGTHPDQIAQWMRGTNIRSENRLHICRVENLDAPQVSELLGRVCNAFEPGESQGNIVDAYLRGNILFVRGPQQRMLHVPIASLPALRNLAPEVLRDFRIDPDGSFIHWPVPDVHLGWNQFLQATDPLELHKAQQRSDDFNHRYGAAIRKLREKAGILQTKVEGLTERQLRRIEQGECRATTNALRHISKAHGLSMNEYMEKIAHLMH